MKYAASSDNPLARYTTVKSFETSVVGARSPYPTVARVTTLKYNESTQLQSSSR